MVPIGVPDIVTGADAIEPVIVSGLKRPELLMSITGCHECVRSGRQVEDARTEVHPRTGALLCQVAQSKGPTDRHSEAEVVSESISTGGEVELIAGRIRLLLFTTVLPH